MKETVKTSLANETPLSFSTTYINEEKEESKDEDLSEYPCSMVFLNLFIVNIPDLEEITKCLLFHVDATATTRNEEVIQLFCHIYGLEKALKAS